MHLFENRHESFMTSSCVYDRYNLHLTLEQTSRLQAAGKEHSAGQTLLTWEDRNKVKVKHYWKIYFWTPQLRRIQENMHLNSSKLKLDKNHRPDKKKVLSYKEHQPGKSLPKPVIHQCQGLKRTGSKSSLMACLKLFQKLWYRHLSATATGCKARSAQVTFSCVPDLNPSDIGWSPRKPRTTLCQSSGFWNSTVFIQMGCISHSGSTL